MKSKQSSTKPANQQFTFFVFAAILAVAAFLRFHQLESLMPFISDQGRDYLAASEMIQTGEIPLLGIPSSVPRFHQGPVYVWMTAVALFIGDMDPYVPALMSSAVGLLSVGGLFIFARKYFNLETAILSSLILGTSPFAVMQSRLAFHTNPIPLVSIFYLWSLIDLYKTGKRIWLTSFLWAMLFQFELVVAPIVLLIPLVVWFRKEKVTINLLAKGVFGLAIGLLPQILFDLTHGFKQLGVFAIWMGYRITGFFGLSQEHVASGSKLARVSDSIFIYSQKFFSWFSEIPLFVVGALIINQLRKSKTAKDNLVEIILMCWLGLMLVAFVIMGNASEAYFPVLFIPATLLVSISMTRICPSWVKNTFISGVLLVSVFNSHFLVSNSFLVNIGEIHPTNPFNTYGPPISDQIEVLQYLGSLDQPINLKSSDANAEFKSYLDNYRYLAEWQQIEQSEEGVPVWINHTPPKPIVGTKTITIGAIYLSVPEVL